MDQTRKLYEKILERTEILAFEPERFENRAGFAFISQFQPENETFDVPSNKAKKIVKLSRPEHAISYTNQILLRSPTYYHDADEKGVADGKDGTASHEATQMVKELLPKSIQAEVMGFKASFETNSTGLLFCASHFDKRIIKQVQNEFDENYSVITIINDANKFAKLLAAKIMEDFDGSITVRINHGPVKYTDTPKILDFSSFAEDSLNPFHIHPFLKKTRFSKQNEYRFHIQINSLVSHLPDFRDGLLVNLNRDLTSLLNKN